MLFSNVISDKVNQQILIDGVSERKIPHAQLFFGPKGCGKLATTLAYIQYILCENKTGKDSCGICPNCKKNKLLIHPDVHFVFPVYKRNSSDKPTSVDYLDLWRGMILKSPYRDLQTWTEIISNDKKKLEIYVHEAKRIEGLIKLKSYQGGHKIFAIWNAEKLNEKASNKLLKNLEEPPNKNVFILISEKKELLINTVLSRLINLQFTPPNLIDVRSLLEKKFQIENPQEIEYQGNYNKLIDIVVEQKQDDKKLFIEWFVEWMRLCFQAKKGNKIEQLIVMIEEFSDLNRSKQIDFLKYVLENFRKSFLYNYDLTESLRLKIKHDNFYLDKFSVFVHRKNIFLIFYNIDETIYYISRNANSKLLFLDLSMKLSKLMYKDLSTKAISHELS